MLTILFIFMILVFFGYVSFIWDNYGTLPSISDSYYFLPDNQKILFTAFCAAFAFPAMVLGGTPLMFLAGTGIIFVGAAAQFKKPHLPKIVHYTGAVLGVLFSQLSIYFDYNMLYINIIFFTSAGIIFFLRKTIFKNFLWWIEMLAFTSIVYVLFCSLFF